MELYSLKVEASNHQAPAVQGVLIDSSSSISILQSASSPDSSVHGISISAFQSGSEMFLGGHALISTQCISDVSLVSQGTDFLIADQAILSKAPFTRRLYMLGKMVTEDSICWI